MSTLFCTCAHALDFTHDILNYPSQSSEEFHKRYDNALIGSEYTTTLAATVAFDAAWTMGLVLNYTEEMRLNNQLKNNSMHENCSSSLAGDLVPLNEFNYSNAYMGCVMKSNFYKVNFLGTSVS